MALSRGVSGGSGGRTPGGMEVVVSGLDRDALDRWITGGRYSKAIGLVECPECEETTQVFTETEYGATTWEPEVCSTTGCNHEFTGQEPWHDAEPPEPDHHEPEDYDGPWDVDPDRRVV